MLTLRILGLWLHLLAVVVWLGSAVAWMLVLVTPGSEDAPTWSERVEPLGRRIYTVGWEAIFVILLTGLFNLLPAVESGRLVTPEYYTAVLVKLSMFAGMIALQAWQHGWLLPELREETSPSRPSGRVRTLMLMASGLLVALGAGALWIGVSLRY